MHHFIILVSKIDKKGANQLKCKTDTCGSPTVSTVLIVSLIKGKENLASVLPAIKKIF